MRNAIKVSILVIVVGLLIGLSAYFASQYVAPKPQYTVDQVTAVLQTYNISIVNTNDLYHHNGFSQTPIFVLFDTPQDFSEFCNSKGITTVMHWYGSMYPEYGNYDYFYFIEGETVYRYLIPLV